MKPSVGRTVLFQWRAGSEPLPATITRCVPYPNATDAETDYSVTLCVLPDGVQLESPRVVGGVPFSSNPAIGHWSWVPKI